MAQINKKPKRGAARGGKISGRQALTSAPEKRKISLKQKPKKPSSQNRPPFPQFIEVINACQNNLKNVSVQIPLGRMTVICGLSGSGKSSLAFETLYAEGQRRYLESLSNYVRQYVSQQAKPLVEDIRNLPPALALEQKNKVRSGRALVAAASGISDYLRLLFEAGGQPWCEKHKTALKEFSAEKVVDFLFSQAQGEKALVAIPVQSPPNKSESAALLKKLVKGGFSRILTAGKPFGFSSVKIQRLEEINRLPNKDFFILLDRLILEKSEKERLLDSLGQAFSLPNILSLHEKSSGIFVFTEKKEALFFSRQKSCPYCRKEFSFPLTAQLFSFNSPLGACPACKGSGIRIETNKDKVIPRAKLSLEEGAILPFASDSAWMWEKAFKGFLSNRGHSL